MKQQSLHKYFSFKTKPPPPGLSFLNPPHHVKHRIYDLAGFLRSCPINLNLKRRVPTALFPWWVIESPSKRRLSVLLLETHTQWGYRLCPTSLLLLVYSSRPTTSVIIRLPCCLRRGFSYILLEEQIHDSYEYVHWPSSVREVESESYCSFNFPFNLAWWYATHPV